MDTKFTKIIFEFNKLSYKNFNKNNIIEYSPEEVFCAFYTDLIFYFSKTGFYFIITHNCLNYKSDSDPILNDIHLLDFFVKSTKDLNKKIQSPYLSYFINYLESIYKINIDIFIDTSKNINKELNKFVKIEEEFFEKRYSFEKVIALFLCDNYYNEEFKNIFPEFKTL